MTGRPLKVETPLVDIVRASRLFAAGLTWFESCVMRESIYVLL